MSDWNIVGKPALILLHMQHAICDPEGRIAHVGHAKAAHESGIIPNQQALLKAFREKKLPVIFINATTDPTKLKTAPVLGKFWGTVTGGVNMPNTKDVQVIKELAPQPGEPVIGNFPFSMFANNNLDQMLKDLGVKPRAGWCGYRHGRHRVLLAGLRSVLQPGGAFRCLGGREPGPCDAAMKMINAISMVTPTDDVLQPRRGGTTASADRRNIRRRWRPSLVNELLFK